MSGSVRHTALTRIGCLLGATALTLAALPVFAQTAGQADIDDCSPINGRVPPACEAPNQDVAVQTIPGQNTEFDRTATPAPEGFMITVDGQPVNGDKRMLDVIRRTDLALERADIQVTFDGLSVRPRLDLETLGDRQGYAPGDTVGFQSATNFPDAGRDQDHRPRGARGAADGRGRAGRSERTGTPDATRGRRSGRGAQGL
jgi:hypothetical protein